MKYQLLFEPSAFAVSRFRRALKAVDTDNLHFRELTQDEVLVTCNGITGSVYRDTVGFFQIRLVCGGTMIRAFGTKDLSTTQYIVESLIKELRNNEL